MAISDRGYILGHAADERQRLDRQGQRLRPLTERLLRAAGIGSGMRVLDVGCGTGDVSLLAAELVGPEGQVIGVDRAAAALATARAHAAARGWRHVSFVEAELATLTLPEPVDAVVGRLILLQQPDPAATLRRLFTLARPGGALAFLEMAMAPGRSIPDRPLFSQTFQRITAAFDRSGADVLMGLRLPAAFHNAGIPAAGLLCEPITIVGSDPAWLGLLAAATTTLAPAMAQFELATPDELASATLFDRLLAEATATPTAVAGPAYVGAWAWLPDAAQRA